MNHLDKSLYDDNSKQQHKAKPLTACDACRKRKIKCEIKSPSSNCESCFKRNRDCSFNFIKSRNSLISSPHYPKSTNAIPTNSIENSEFLTRKNVYPRPNIPSREEIRGLRILPPLHSLILQPEISESIEELRQILLSRQVEWSLDFHAVAMAPTFFQRFGNLNLIHLDSFIMLLRQSQRPPLVRFLLHSMACYVLQDQSEPLSYHNKEAYTALATLPSEYQLLMSGLSLLNLENPNTYPNDHIKLPRIEHWSPSTSLPNIESVTKSLPSDHIFK